MVKELLNKNIKMRNIKVNSNMEEYKGLVRRSLKMEVSMRDNGMKV